MTYEILSGRGANWSSRRNTSETNQRPTNQQHQLQRELQYQRVHASQRANNDNSTFALNRRGVKFATARKEGVYQPPPPPPPPPRPPPAQKLQGRKG